MTGLICIDISTAAAQVGSANLTVTGATLVSIGVTPATTSLPTGIGQQFTATGTYTDGSVADLTGAVTWSSSAPSIATITSDGLATGVSASAVPVQIVAQLTGVIGATNLTVTSATLSSLAVTPAALSLPVGVGQQFTATGTYTDGFMADLTGVVTWSSSAPSIATITSDGLATGVSAGAVPVQIVAQLTGVFGATNLTVTSATLSSLAVTPAALSLPVGVGQQFTATGTYTDGFMADLTGVVTWSSSAPSIATITSDGLATGVSAGAVPVQIVAQLTGVFGATNLTVTSATLSSLAVTPAALSLPVGVGQQFTATGTYTDGFMADLTGVVTWSSSAPSIATITSGGLATGVSANGSPVQIIARFETNTGPTCSTAQPSYSVLWPPNHQLVRVSIVGVTDPNGGATATQVTNVTQDEPLNGFGDGDTSPDALSLADGTVLLRAERAARGNGRVYRIEFRAADQSGGSCTGSVSIGVPIDMKPGRPLVDDGQRYHATQP